MMVREVAGKLGEQVETGVGFRAALCKVLRAGWEAGKRRGGDRLLGSHALSSASGRKPFLGFLGKRAFPGCKKTQSGGQEQVS